MSKHTPGPWRMDTPLEDACEIDIYDARERTIAAAKGDHFDPLNLRHSREWCDEHWPRNDEAAANARLIAKAPEMHALLQQIIRVLSSEAYQGMVATANVHGFRWHGETFELDAIHTLLSEIDGDNK